MAAPDQLVIPGMGTVPMLGKVYVDDFEHAEPRSNCILCEQQIQLGEAWERLTPADSSYSVVVHTACLHAGN